MAHAVAAVEAGGIGDQCGIKPGDLLLSINSIPVLDQIDYQFLTAQEKLVLEIENQDGICALHLEKDAWEPLGLTFASTMMSKPRPCANHCIFCFIDQMPKGMRSTLYVKDDDWRLSLMMGNYITLTNISDQELNRIIARRASPLHISVHATDGEVRARMMGNPKATNILEKLTRFKDAGIAFHCQIVLCPFENDGDTLDNTLTQLSQFHPAALSVALVPVGLTAHREGLPVIVPYTTELAKRLLDQAHACQQRFLQSIGTRFVYPADEFYCVSGLPLPEEAAYEHYPQIENGVGLLRRFETEYSFAYQNMDASETVARHVVVATGVSAAPYLDTLLKEKPVAGIVAEVIAIPNQFFGGKVTVAGLLTGQDLLDALQGVSADEILIPSVTLRREDNLFLDGMPLAALQDALTIPIHAVEADGAAFLYALQGEQFHQEE